MSFLNDLYSLRKRKLINSLFQKFRKRLAINGVQRNSFKTFLSSESKHCQSNFSQKSGQNLRHVLKNQLLSLEAKVGQFWLQRLYFSWKLKQNSVKIKESDFNFDSNFSLKLKAKIHKLSILGQNWTLEYPQFFGTCLHDFNTRFTFFATVHSTGKKKLFPAE